jgi:hypothetical protein
MKMGDMDPKHMQIHMLMQHLCKTVYLFIYGNICQVLSSGTNYLTTTIMEALFIYAPFQIMLIGD